MSEQRTPRAKQTRDQSQREVEWRPTSALPVPDSIDGWCFRWVRLSSYGETDVKNMSKRLREHWVPVKREEHPEIDVLSDYDFLQKEVGTNPEHIEIGGLLLCKCPEEIIRQRREYYDRFNKDQMEAVDSNFMKLEDSRMPLYNERRSQVKFGSNSRK